MYTRYRGAQNQSTVVLRQTLWTSSMYLLPLKTNQNHWGNKEEKKWNYCRAEERNIITFQ